MVNILLQIWRWLISFTRRGKLEREMEEEMRFHLEMQIEQNLASGMAAEEAHYAARRQFGNQTWLKEASREMWSLRFLETLIQDLCYGARMLVKNPSFTLIAVLTLALGIGANTAIFSVVNGVLLKPLPYEQPGQLVNLWEAAPWGKSTVSPGAFTDWKESSTRLEALSVVRGADMNLAGEGEPERLTGLTVSASYLQILRLQPMFGRRFSPDEDKPGHDNKVVVIAHALWQRRFGADPGVVGRAIRLNSEPYTVIGVLPPKAVLAGKDGADDPQFLVPFIFGMDEEHTTRSNHLFNVIARLKPTVTREQAQAELTAIKQRLKPLYPKDKEDWGVEVAPLQEHITGKMKPTLLVLMGAVGFVLLITCANVANLLLAKAASRQKEMSIRAALGASRWRVIRQALTESSILALLGGLSGVGLAYWGVQALSRWGEATLPRVGEIGLDGRVLVFSLFTSVGAGLLFGLVPALQVSAPNLNDALKEGGRGSGTGSHNRARACLVVAEVAIALTLLVGAGLLFKSFFHLLNVDPGFSPENALALDISLPKAKYPVNSDARSRFLHRIFEKLEALPGVEAAGMASSVPMLGWSNSTNLKRADRPERDYNAPFNSVSGNYFSALDIPLLRGRVFSARDDFTDDLRLTTPLVVVINEALAKKIFPNEDPIGKRVHFWERPKGGALEWEIVGVVGNVRQTQLDDAGLERLYLPQAFFWQDGSLIVRTKGPPLALAESIRKEILALDSETPVSNIRTMEQVISRSVSARRFTLALLGIFAGVALGLAVIGLYGVMAYAVTQRSHEIGIRMALGAQRHDVLRLVINHGMKLTLIGVALGLVAALALTRLMAGLLFGVTPTDPATFIAIAALLIIVALLACWIPARRAASMDPLVSLRVE